MKQSIVKDLTTDEVRAKIGEERTSYTKMKMAHAVSPIENSMKIQSLFRLKLVRSIQSMVSSLRKPKHIWPTMKRMSVVWAIQ